MKQLHRAINEAIDLSLNGIESTVVWCNATQSYHAFPYHMKSYDGFEIIKHFK